VSNAFKYTDEGFVELGYELNENEILFYVKDTGRGIDKEQHILIFDRFKQLENPSKGVISGTGLGLSIAKGLIELLGGRIWLESEVNKGSTFFFTIPYEEAMVSERKKKANMIEKEGGIPQFKGKKILIAEDDPFSMEMLRHYLQATGSILFFAPDGEKSLELFREQEIDLVLLDIRLPKKPGYEVVKEMKITHPEIPVIAQTAYAMYEDVHKFKERGFDEYLVKPLDSGKLYCILQKYLG
jgi:CheY-like chemotaxis protein